MKQYLVCISTVGLLIAMAAPAMSADVKFIGVVKGQDFEQSGSSFVAMINSDYDKPLVFEAFAEGATTNSLVSGTLQMPDGTTTPLVREYDTDLRCEYQSDTLLDLNTVRSNGIYTLNLVTKNDGTKNVTLSLTNDTYPSVPVVTNFNTLQTITNTAITTIRWSPMTNGTAVDFIMCSVYDNDTGETVFETGNIPGTSNALKGTNVFATIPAKTLVAGRTYEGGLLFVKVVNVNTNSYAGVLAIAGYYKYVNFILKTVASNGVALGSEFVSSIPQNNAGDVPRDSAVSFRFSQPMSTNRSITWTFNGVAATNFVYYWVDGNKVLLCRCTTNLPANSNIGWSLNLSGFKDTRNFALTGSVEGSFNTSSEDPLSPPDVPRIYLLKMRGYQQTGTNSPVSTGMYGCDASVEMAAYNRVKQGTLTVVANGYRGSLVADEWDPRMGIEASYASQTDLDRFFANGNFTFTLSNLVDGVRTVTLSMGTTNDYPAVPTVINLAALQAVNPDAPITINWVAPANWTNVLSVGRCLIELGIDNLPQEEEVYWFDYSSFTSSSSYTIPAYTLWPGRTYRLRLYFIKGKDLDTSYLGVTGAAGFESITEFTIQTTGTVIKPTVAMKRDGNGLNLNISGGEPQRSYILSTSTNMQRWMPQTEVWFPDSQTNQWYDQDFQYLKKRFYRLKDRAAREFAQQNVAIQGTVWTDGSHSTPLAGAVVSTDLDAQTAVTDSSGRFFLETDTPGSGGMNSYTITVISGGTYKDFGPSQWGDQPRELTFEVY